MSWEPRRAVLEVEITRPTQLLIGQFYYPGWQARNLTDHRLLPVSPSAPDGFLMVNVPAGRHQILLQLEAGTPERLGIAVSMISCLLAFVWGIVSFGVAYRSRQGQLPCCNKIAVSDGGTSR